jgi:glycosyltransferase involved in cell wall biosynthesis
LAAELQSLGHQVVIIAPPYTNPEDSGKTEVVDGIPLHNVELGRGNKIKVTFQTSWRVYRAAMEAKPDLIHLFKPKGYGGLAAMYLVLKNLFSSEATPLFVDTDDWEGKGGMNEIQPYSSAEKWLFDFQERWLPQKALGVTVASRALESQVRERGASEEKVLYLPNCVEPKAKGAGEKVCARHRIEPETPVVLLYTRFFEFNQERLYSVFHSIVAEQPEARLMVVGKGRHGEEDALLRAAQQMSFAENLLLVGWTEPEEIPDYLAAADVAIYPLDDTLVNRAKCPAKLTEIMLAGCPVVADKVGQAQEYLQHGKNGLLVDPQHPEEMVQAVISLLNDPDRGRSLGNNARNSLLTDFRWQQSAEQLHKFYQRCLSHNQ